MKLATGAQDAEHVAHQGLLVGDVDDAVLGEHDVEGAGREGQRAGGGLDDADPVQKARFRDPRAGDVEHAVLDVEGGDETRAVFPHQCDVDAPRAAADVEDRGAGQIRVADQTRHLGRAAGRQEPAAPEGFEQGNEGGRVEVGQGVASSRSASRAGQSCAGTMRATASTSRVQA